MTHKRQLTACFTGHRKIRPGEESRLRERVEQELRALILQGYDTFITGGALGFDTLAQQVVLGLRQEFPYIRSFMAIPCEDQDKLWAPEDRAVYRSLVKAADACSVLSPVYTPICMRERNRFMVDHSSCCIAYYDGNPRSGTGSTVRYAREQNVPVVNLYGE